MDKEARYKSFLKAYEPIKTKLKYLKRGKKAVNSAQVSTIGDLNTKKSTDTALEDAKTMHTTNKDLQT